MQNKNLLIATAALAGVAFSGALLPPENTYAVTSEETAAVDAVIDELKTDYQDLIDDYNASDPDEELTLTEEESTSPYLYYRSASMKAYTQLDSATHLGAQTSGGAYAEGLLEYDSIIEALTDLGFVEYEDAIMDSEYLNASTGVICAVGEVNGISCGHINWQTISDTWTEYLNGIGAAYYTSKGAYPSIYRKDTFSSGAPTIYNSDYEPYQYTTAIGNGAALLFYRSSSTSDWIYFTGTQDYVLCSAFTGEAAKGFAGYVCYDEDTDSVSKVTVATESDASSDSTDSTTTTTSSTTITAPNTGSPSSSDGGSAIFTTSLAVASLSLAAYLLNYARKLIKTRVRFEKH